MIFTEGQFFAFRLDLAREEIVQRVKEEEQPDYAVTIPIRNAAKKIQAWRDAGTEILYLTSRRSLDEIEQMREVLQRYEFPVG